jgi:glucose 1-dehydrogenase
VGRSLQLRSIEGRHHDAHEKHCPGIRARRIRVNSIAPGAIRTPINAAAWQTKQAYDSLMRLVPYRRIGEPDDIGKAAVWLASDQPDYVVGATLFVDGGMTLFPGFATGG